MAFIVCFLLGEFLHIRYLRYLYKILEKPTASLLKKIRAEPVISSVEEAGGSWPKGNSRDQAVSMQLPQERISTHPL